MSRKKECVKVSIYVGRVTQCSCKSELQHRFGHLGHNENSTEGKGKFDFFILS